MQVTFKYIFGGNIELDVTARHIPEEVDTLTNSDFEIEEVKLDGLDVEIDDIAIYCGAGNFRLIEAFLIEEAWDAWAKVCKEGYEEQESER